MLFRFIVAHRVKKLKGLNSFCADFQTNVGFIHSFAQAVFVSFAEIADKMQKSIKTP